MWLNDPETCSYDKGQVAAYKTHSTNPLQLQKPVADGLSADYARIQTYTYEDVHTTQNTQLNVNFFFRGLKCLSLLLTNKHSHL